MKKSIICLLLITVLAAGLVFNTSAADTPDLKVTDTAPLDGSSTVSVEFVNIPENNPVEYAQILLTCRTNPHNITKNTLSFKGNADDMLLTQTFNTTADNLLVLLEPQSNTSVGIGNGLVYTFTLRHTTASAEAAGFDLAAVLILKDGTEYELNQRITAQPASTPTNPTDPTTQPPTTVPVTPPTTEPTTPSATPNSTTPTGNSGNNGSNFLDANTMLIVLCVALAAMFASICLFITIRKQKK